MLACPPTNLWLTTWSWQDFLINSRLHIASVQLSLAIAGYSMLQLLVKSKRKLKVGFPGKINVEFLDSQQRRNRNFKLNNSRA